MTPASAPKEPAWKPREIPIRPAESPVSVDRARASKYVKIGLTAAVAGAGLWMLWPSDEPVTHAGVCVDKDTHQRLDDRECNGGSGSHHSHVGWYFIPFEYNAPRVGAPVSGGSFDAPRGTSYVTGGVSSNGGSVSSSSVKGGKTTTVRGGFGGSGKSSGG